MESLQNNARRAGSRYKESFQSSSALGKLALAILPLIATCCLCGICAIPTAALLPDITPTVVAESISEAEGQETAEEQSSSEKISQPEITETSTEVPLTDTAEPAETSTSPPEPTNTRRDTSTPKPPTDTPVPPTKTSAPPTNTSVPPTNTSIPPTSTPGNLATVVAVINGDTIDVDMGGTIYRVRYIGMDTPEQGMPYFQEASSANAALVSGQVVRLEKDFSETDQFGRLLRYVYLQDGTFVSAELVRQGYAQAATYPPDVAHSDYFPQLQQEARNAGLGLWSAPPPTATPIPVPATQAPPAQNCHPCYSGACLLMGIGDYDCAGGSGNGPHYVEGPIQVIGPDEFRLDGDGDGIGCE